MNPKSFMLIAGEPSGDLLGAELVRSLREKVTKEESTPTDDRQPLHASLMPEFFGAGGSNMAAAGVELAFDMTEHAIVGLPDVIRHYAKFRRLFRQLLAVARQRLPDVIICIDFSGFNLRFARAVRTYAQSLQGTFANWDPSVIQYVSPQVWASRPQRARRLARDVSLLLSVVPFEKEWYRARVPELKVVFVGHPVVDRYVSSPDPLPEAAEISPKKQPEIVLLPGSRRSELLRHLPIMIEALAQIRQAKPGVRARVILPNKELVAMARSLALPPALELQSGGLGLALAGADLAIASTGTVTLECAYFGLPTVALYRTSAANYWIGKQLVQVNYLAMPNLLAKEEVFPEFIQNRATPTNIAGAALALLDDPGRLRLIRAKLREIVAGLGAPGASDRAAEAILAAIGGRQLRASLGSISGR